MNNITMTLQVDHLIMEALREDISSEDVTTNAVMHEAVTGEVDLICKQDGVIAGLQIFQRVFELLDKDTKVEFFCKDGDEVKNGQLMGKVTGDIRVLLSGERVALNYLQRMSGIASYTHSVASLLEGSKTKLLDTRKTTPNMRIFEKYAVRVGGGYNHRYNLSDYLFSSFRSMHFLLPPPMLFSQMIYLSMYFSPHTVITSIIPHEGALRKYLKSVRNVSVLRWKYNLRREKSVC